VDFLVADFVFDFALDAVFCAPEAVFRVLDVALRRAVVAFLRVEVVFLRPAEVAFFVAVVARFRVEDAFLRAADVDFFPAADVFLRADVVDFFRAADVFFLADVDLLRADDVLLRAGDDLRPDVLRPPPLDDPSSLSLPSPISFRATPTAAGIATPSVVPATTSRAPFRLPSEPSLRHLSGCADSRRGGSAATGPSR
jgi:hypothetical protein